MWYGYWHPWPWWPKVIPYPYFRYAYGYPWGAMPKKQEIAILEAQERWLTNLLTGVRKRLEELKK
jgi:hypothetical protein